MNSTTNKRFRSTSRANNATNTNVPQNMPNNQETIPATLGGSPKITAKKYLNRTTMIGNFQSNQNAQLEEARR